MGIETATDEIAQGSAAGQAALAGTLLSGEEIVATLEGDDGARFFLTTARVLHTGGGTTSRRWSSAMIEAVNGVEFASRPKDRSSLGWAILGFLGALGIWQVSTNDVVGIAGGIVIGLISAALAIDYLFFDPGSQLLFHAGSGSVGGPVRDADAPAAREFADRFFALREAKGRRPAPSRRLPRYPSA